MIKYNNNYFKTKAPNLNLKKLFYIYNYNL